MSKKCGGGVGGAGCGVEFSGLSGKPFFSGRRTFAHFLFFLFYCLTSYISSVCILQKIMSRNTYYPTDHIRTHRIYPPSPPNTATAISTPTSPHGFMTLKPDSTEKWYATRQQPRTYIQKPIENDDYFNVDKVVQQYGEHPELLELILSSKLEEDRRRAEEAKLRQKEIDYILQQQQSMQQWRTKGLAETLPRISSFSSAVENGWRNNFQQGQQLHTQAQDQQRNSSLLLSQPIIPPAVSTCPQAHTYSASATTTGSTLTLPPILSPNEPSVPIHPPHSGPSTVYRRDSTR